MMAQFRPPERLNFKEPIWDAWRSSFQTFRVTTRLDLEKDDIQIATLKYSMGPEAEEIMKSFGIDNISLVTFDEVLSLFDSYFKPRKNIIRFRRLFQLRKQESKESVDQYVRALTTAAENCEFIDREERIRDQFVFGIRSEKLREKLEQLYTSSPLDFTLEKVVSFARENVCLLDKEPEQNGTKRPASTCSLPSGRYQFLCKKCGFTHPSSRCPAFGKICSNCSEANHFARFCPDPRKSAKRTSDSASLPQKTAAPQLTSTSQNLKTDPPQKLTAKRVAPSPLTLQLFKFKDQPLPNLSVHPNHKPNKIVQNRLYNDVCDDLKKL